MSEDTGLDVVVIGSALVEITPAELGRPLAEVEKLVPLPSGSAANFAAVLAGLGVEVGFISRVGADELGRWLITRLAERGIRTDFIRMVEGQMTPVSFCWMDQEGEKTFYFYRFPGFCDPMATLREQDLDAVQVTAGRLFDFTEATIRHEPLRAAALRAAELAREAGREVCYAVNYRPASWGDQSEDEIVATQRRACGAADLVVMNEQEAHLIAQTSDLRPQTTDYGNDERRRLPSVRGPRSEVRGLIEQAARGVADLGPRLVIITSGEEGSLLLADRQAVHVPARRVEVAYDIGAGDAFHAGLLAAHLRGMSPPEAARFASDTAALRISRDASAPGPTFEEVAALSAAGGEESTEGV